MPAKTDKPKTEREAASRRLASETLRQAATALDEDRLDDFELLINLVAPILFEGVEDQVAAFLEKEQCEREDM